MNTEPPPIMRNEHLDSDVIAAFAERRLPEADRALAEVHLAECTDCRADLAEVAALVSGRRTRRWRIVAPVAAAAAVLAIVLVNRAPAPSSGQLAMRPGDTSGPEGLNSLQPIEPAPGSEPSRAALRFTWRADGVGALYDLTLADSTGLALWRTRITDTTLVLPDSVRLTPDSRYHWWVDVLLGDGRVATTGVRDFVLRP
jgi:hypothetical protein